MAGEAAGGSHLQAVLGLYAEAPRVAAPADRVEHRIGILQRHVAMARGGALEAGDLAAHAHPLEGPLERALPRQGALRDSELRPVAGSSSGLGGAAGGAIGLKIPHACSRLVSDGKSVA